MLRKVIYASVVAVAFGMVAATPAFAEHRHYHVQYRLSEWRERTFTCHEESHEFAAEKRRQGYEASVDHHGSHYHVRFRMLGWQTLRTVESHRAAHDLERLLERRGYNVRVVHH